MLRSICIISSNRCSNDSTKLLTSSINLTNRCYHHKRSSVIADSTATIKTNNNKLLLNNGRRRCSSNKRKPTCNLTERKSTNASNNSKLLSSSNKTITTSTIRNEMVSYLHGKNPRLINTIIRNKSSTTARKRNIRRKSSLGASQQQYSLFDRMKAILLYPQVLPLPRWLSPKKTSVTISEIFGHGSFLLITISYAMDDFLMLRYIAVLGSTFMLFFTYFHPHGRPLWLPFKWNFIFILINLYRIKSVYEEQRLGENLEADLLALNRDYMSLLTTADFAKMVQISTQEHFNKGDVVITQGQKNSYVRLVVSGTIDVLRDDSLNYHIYRGDFISESGLHAGLYLDDGVESPATCIASSKALCLRWKREDLMKLLRKERTLSISLKSVLSWDIIHKLKTQREVIINRKVTDIDKWTQKRKEQSDHRYRAILHNILSHHGQLDGHKCELNNYRTIHNIDEERHNMALKTCGWTPEEYELGRKVEGNNDDDNDYGDNNFFIHLLRL